MKQQNKGSKWEDVGNIKMTKIPQIIIERKRKIFQVKLTRFGEEFS